MNATHARKGFLPAACRWLLTASWLTLASGAAAAPDPPEPFWGPHQGGIVNVIQHHTYFAAFDVVTTRRAEVIRLLKAWTLASARMAAGETAQPLASGLQLAVPPAETASAGNGYDLPPEGPQSADSGEAIGMSPSRLTLTFGFGAGLFLKDGQDRFGLASRRPAALVDMPLFPGDQMVDQRTGGDISVQACAEDPQVAFHAVRQLARIGEGVVRLRWVQTGFRTLSGSRHLLGFSVEGMENPSVSDPKVMEKTVWCGSEGPAWMEGGSYVVARRIRFAIEHWDHMPAEYQERAMGGGKFNGPAPAIAFRSAAANGGAHPDQPDHLPSHMDLAAPEAATLYRRSYSFNDGLDFTAERWPPWRQGLEYDVGMLFLCYQKDPRTGFIRMYQRLASKDFMMNQFWTHEGGGLFACPPGAAEGGYIGQKLFEAP
jgi:deferrochelatase/peroxidase EfeB